MLTDAASARMYRKVRAVPKRPECPLAELLFLALYRRKRNLSYQYGGVGHRTHHGGVGILRNFPDNNYHPLHAIFKWAGFTMGVKYEHSPGATLLTNLGVEWIARAGDDMTDPETPTITLDEFASTPPRGTGS